jgi:hypothetical protein
MSNSASHISCLSVSSLFSMTFVFKGTSGGWNDPKANGIQFVALSVSVESTKYEVVKK